MRARVYYSDPWWYGEVYANWTFLGEYWMDVTSPCLTKIGAIIELKSWLRKNKAYEVKI